VLQRHVSSKTHGEPHEDGGGLTSDRWLRELHLIGIDLDCVWN